MPDIWMDVDTALSEVPVNLLPLIDDTDFKTVEAAVAYDAGGLALRWHFVTTGGAFSTTDVTPTTGGAHDWSAQGDDGLYTIEIPASGGTISNDTEGFGWFTGVATGVLPWRGPVIGFRAAALNNALIDGGDTLDVNVTQIEGVDATDQIRDACWTETATELTGAPAQSATFRDKLEWLFTLAKNKITQTATTMTVRNDADNATISTSTVSDDGTTFTRGEFTE